ncbi:MAG: HAD-IA family hydrolase [Chromatiales bacterium]|nr:HAD-IA family hydrolase [Chromatiales bacterium]
MRNIRTVLFDLDGTLADTAPDLAFALNEVLREQGCEPLPFEQIRPVVSHGGIALIKLGFNIDETAPQFDALRQRLLAIYREHIVRGTTLFAGMTELLDEIEGRGLNWGVVTNKPGWLTEPLLEGLALKKRAATIVSGDTLPERKPHPAPMLLACQQAGSAAAECLYVGDAERDIEAGRNAGMHTLVALFGYIGNDDKPASWRADGMVESAEAILQWL